VLFRLSVIKDDEFDSILTFLFFLFFIFYFLFFIFYFFIFLFFERAIASPQGSAKVGIRVGEERALNTSLLRRKHNK